MSDLKTLIRDVPDFPKQGILFRDITPLLANGPAWRDLVDQLAERYRNRIDIVLGIESHAARLANNVSDCAQTFRCGPRNANWAHSLDPILRPRPRYRPVSPFVHL